MKQPIVWILSMYWLSAAADECQECQGEAPQTKAGVAMLVKTRHAKHVSGIESTEDTQGIEREAALVRQVLTSPTAELSLSMVEELAAMRITPEVAAFINGTLANLRPVFGDIEDASDKDAKRRNDWLKEFQKLQDELAKGHEKVNNTRVEVQKWRQEHLDCRDDEKVALDAKTKCDGELSILLSEKNAAMAALKTQTTALTGLICGKSGVVDKLQQKVDTAGPYAASARKYVEAAAAYAKKKTECDAKTQIYTDQRAKCSTKQAWLEGCVCIEGQKNQRCMH